MAAGVIAAGLRPAGPRPSHAQRPALRRLHSSTHQLRKTTCSVAAGGSDHARSSESDADYLRLGGLESSSRLHTTLQTLDSLLGVEEQPATPVADAVAAATAAVAAEAVAELPPHWANLPAKELQRRRLLMRRSAQLSEKAVALEAAVRQQERKASFERQRLSELRDEFRALALQQRMLQDAIDPEAAAAAQLAQMQAREAEAAADRVSLTRFVISFWMLFAAFAVGHDAAMDLSTQMQELWIDLSFL